MTRTRSKRAWSPASIAASGRRVVGEPHFSVVLAFFNVVPLAALVAVVEMASVCFLLHPESTAARYVSDWVSGALQLTALLGSAVSLMQLVPGAPRWRDLRQRAGLVNLVLIWPAVCMLGLIAYLEIPGGLRVCP